jgi:hypothetical protein
MLQAKKDGRDPDSRKSKGPGLLDRQVKSDRNEERKGSLRWQARKKMERSEEGQHPLRGSLSL